MSVAVVFAAEQDIVDVFVDDPGDDEGCDHGQQFRGGAFSGGLVDAIFESRVHQHVPAASPEVGRRLGFEHRIQHDFVGLDPVEDVVQQAHADRFLRQGRAQQKSDEKIVQQVPPGDHLLQRVVHGIYGCGDVAGLEKLIAARLEDRDHYRDDRKIPTERRQPLPKEFPRRTFRVPQIEFHAEEAREINDIVPQARSCRNRSEPEKSFGDAQGIHDRRRQKEHDQTRVPNLQGSDDIHRLQNHARHGNSEGKQKRQSVTGSVLSIAAVAVAAAFLFRLHCSSLLPRLDYNLEHQYSENGVEDVLEEHDGNDLVVEPKIGREKGADCRCCSAGSSPQKSRRHFEREE
mmetsp:Transcript_4619/g.9733  ORF Transcript_4619/g.9733 Transcript_4619/m.9733 type:complete len:346 (-) Transcript_4619:124-1161(-)